MKPKSEAKYNKIEYQEKHQRALDKELRKERSNKHE